VVVQMTRIPACLVALTNHHCEFNVFYFDMNCCAADNVCVCVCGPCVYMWVFMCDIEYI
jgi:hypothetical protein